MKTSRRSAFPPKGFTLLEMTIVILVMLALMGTGLFTYRKMDEWKLGRAASESLRSVYTAQRMFLADNPTFPLNSLTPALLIPYLPNNAPALPTVSSLTGTTLGITVTASPPVIDAGGGTVYDPSGSNTDSLWDVGE